MIPALAGGFFITSTTWEAQDKNELLINLTPWKDLKTGCAEKAEHKTRTYCPILLHEVLGEAKLVHSKRSGNNVATQRGGVGWGVGWKRM